MSLPEAITLARSRGVDLVEVAPNATPPVCRLVDYGKYIYEQQKKTKESKKHQHANKVKEVQLSPSIDPHDFKTKLHHAIDFLCEEMKVKVTLRFRGREMAHKEFGFQTVEKFIRDLGPYGHADAPPKLIGRGINVMISPHHKSKRAKSPKELEMDRESGGAAAPASARTSHAPASGGSSGPKPGPGTPPQTASGGFSNNPFSRLNLPDQSAPEEGNSSAT